MVWEPCSKLDDLKVQVWRSYLDLGGIAGDIGEPVALVVGIIALKRMDITSASDRPPGSRAG
jgi:hypothetical protein